MKIFRIIKELFLPTEFVYIVKQQYKALKRRDYKQMFQFNIGTDYELNRQKAKALLPYCIAFNILMLVILCRFFTFDTWQSFWFFVYTGLFVGMNWLFINVITKLLKRG